MDRRKEFGSYIRSLREERGITKRQAAIKLGYRGLGTLAQVERGLTPLPIEKIHPLAKLYKVDVEEILDKLKACEPELYRKYMAIEKDLTDYIMEQIKNFGRSKVVQRLAGLCLIIYTLSTNQGPQVSPETSR